MAALGAEALSNEELLAIFPQRNEEIECYRNWSNTYPKIRRHRPARSNRS